MPALADDLQAFGASAEAAKDATGLWRWWTLRAARSFLLGRFEEAEELGARAVAIGRVAENPGVAVISSGLTTALARMRGGLEELEPNLHRLAGGLAAALDARDTASGRAIQLVFGAMRAVVLADLERREEAGRLFEQLAAEALDRVPTYAPWLPTMAFLAETCAYLGDRTRAPLLRRLLLPVAARNVMATTITAAAWGSAQRHLGLLTAVTEQWDAADGHFAEALEMNRRMGALPSVAQTLHGWANALLSRGRAADRARAARMLDEARVIAAELGMKPLAERIARSGGAAPLTRRETEVAALVAGGLTNRRIALELHLSERTVETHLEHIMNKLGFESRARVASWVGERRAAGPQA
jgi:DNA-binding CsgD family transcriptional regulator